MIKDPSKRSVCCGAEVIIEGETTKFYVCLKCGQACDVEVKCET
jgi:hypothetical protein